MKNNRIVALTKLSEDRKAEVRALEALCREADGTEAVAELSNELNFSRRLKCFFLYYEESELIGFMGIFCPDGKTAEIQAFTAPARRRMGVFTTLLEPAGEELKYKDVKQVYFVAEPVSEGAVRTAEAMGMKRCYSELVMRLESDDRGGKNMSKRTDGDEGRSNNRTGGGAGRPEGTDGTGENAGPTDKRTVPVSYFTLSCAADEGGLKYTLFDGDEEVGTAGVYEGGRELFIYGVEIKENLRGQGYGAAFTELLIRDLKRSRTGKQIKLQVRSDNVPAMRIYANCGFVIESERIYYSLK
jgi:ribosomal protein S18 acetylase RimI-like enzyme